MKTCSKCKQEKPFDAFHKRLGGYAYVCKVCKSEYVKATWAAMTPEQIAAEKAAQQARHVQNRELRLDRMRKYQQKNREALAARHRAYYEANKHKWDDKRKENLAADAERSERRRAAQIKATPLWANGERIREIYDFAQEFKDAGFDVHVDHIEPLRGQTVCGLHVEHNLRVCLADANISKGNRQMEHFQ